MLDFGTAPGTDTATIAVTGQGGITATSFIEAWISATATAIHSEDEHGVLAAYIGLTVPPSLIVAGTGFTILGVCPEMLVYGTVSLNWAWT